MLFSTLFSVVIAAAVYRSLGKTNVAMYISVTSNAGNVWEMEEF